MDGPESLENDRCCMLDDRSDLSRAITGLLNVRIVWGPNRLLAIGEISTAVVITKTAARHLFFLSANILLLLHAASAKHLPSSVARANNHPLHNSTVFKALRFHSIMFRSGPSLLPYKGPQVPSGNRKIHLFSSCRSNDWRSRLVFVGTHVGSPAGRTQIAVIVGRRGVFRVAGVNRRRAGP
jgi:hypothetical protein